jgi:hypothetical protein
MITQPDNTMTTQPPSFVQTLKAGAMAGFIGAGLNNIWSFIAQTLGSSTPPGFPLAVTLSSVFPVLVGAILFFLLVKFLPKGQLIWTILSVVFMLVSCYGPFQPTLPDGSPTPTGFPLLTVPMHFISGLVAIWGIPRWSK